MTRSDLIDLVYLFHPRGLNPWGSGYDDTEEGYRQRESARRGIDGHPTWKAMLRRLRARYSFTDRSMPLLCGGYLPAYSAYIEIPGHRIGFHVCLLGPCYGIRRRGADGEETAALDLAREIEATYPGYKPIPPEIGDEVVPDVALDGRGFGQATIYNCLLSQDWEHCSGPWPPSEAELRAAEPLDDAEAFEPGDATVSRDMPIHYVDLPRPKSWEPRKPRFRE